MLRLVAFGLLGMSASFALAQPEGEGRRGPGGPGGPGGFRMPNPLFDAIDADMDGTITSAELEKAAAALKKLDKDGDGKITREEARPEFDRGAFGGGGREGGPGNFSPEDFAARMLERSDANKDGELSADELGERGTRMLETGDANKDGKLDTDELLKLAENMRAQFGNRGGRPGGERPAGEGRGNRPQRPDADGNPPAAEQGDN